MCWLDSVKSLEKFACHEQPCQSLVSTFFTGCLTCVHWTVAFERIQVRIAFSDASSVQLISLDRNKHNTVKSIRQTPDVVQTDPTLAMLKKNNFQRFTC